MVNLHTHGRFTHSLCSFRSLRVLDGSESNERKDNGRRDKARCTIHHYRCSITSESLPTPSVYHPLSRVLTVASLMLPFGPPTRVDDRRVMTGSGLHVFESRLLMLAIYLYTCITFTILLSSSHTHHAPRGARRDTLRAG